MVKSNLFLIIGGALSLIASLLHIAVIFGGPAWYRFFGAGEAMARMAQRGEIAPSLITLFIATILAIWGLYAFSGAGLIGKLPFLKLGLIVITGIYLLRGALVFALPFAPSYQTPFNFYSSAIVLIYGIVHAIGVFRLFKP